METLIFIYTRIQTAVHPYIHTAAQSYTQKESLQTLSDMTKGYGVRQTQDRSALIKSLGWAELQPSGHVRGRAWWKLGVTM